MDARLRRIVEQTRQRACIRRATYVWRTDVARLVLTALVLSLPIPDLLREVLPAPASDVLSGLIGPAPSAAYGRKRWSDYSNAQSQFQKLLEQQQEALRKQQEELKKQLEQQQEQMRKQIEQQQEEMRKQAEQQQEAMRKQVEQQQEQIRQQTELQQEQMRKQAEQQEEQLRKLELPKIGQKAVRGHQAPAPSQGPPKSVADWIGRMISPAAKPPGAPPRPIGTGHGASMLPMTMTREVLAVNPAPGAIQDARRLGFTVRGSTTLDAFGMSILHLSPPPGVDAMSALQSLTLYGIQSGLALNYAYRPYRPAIARDKTPGRGSTPGSGAVRDCSGDRCFGQKAIHWPKKLRRCASATRIGFIDTAIDPKHPAFRGRQIWLGNLLDKGMTKASSDHGTGTLAVLAANQQSGVPGLLPDAEFYVAEVFHKDERGNPVADTTTVLRALNWMSAWNVRVINMSVAGPRDDLVEKAIHTLSQKGIVIVAAAGNAGPKSPPLYPAAYDDVIAVTAVAKDLRSYYRANRGRHIDVAAPGVNIWTALPGGRYGYQTGTSYAVPFVTAVVAASLGPQPVRNKRAVLAAMNFQDLGPRGPDAIYGRGLITAPSKCATRTKSRPSVALAGAGGGGWSAFVSRPAIPSTTASTQPRGVSRVAGEGGR